MKITRYAATDVTTAQNNDFEGQELEEQDAGEVEASDLGNNTDRWEDTFLKKFTTHKKISDVLQTLSGTLVILIPQSSK